LPKVGFNTEQSSISITINPSTFEISSFVPPVKKQGSPGIKFAPIGLTNMFNTGGTIQEELSFDSEEVETCVKMEGISYPPQIHVQSGAC
jgi:stachyose synthetase